MLRSVRDDLDAATIGPLYRAFTPEETPRLARRSEIHPTSAPGSRLNRAETESSIPQRRCLDRRTEGPEPVRQEIGAREARRNEAKATINGRSTIADARVKPKGVFPSIEI